MLFFIDDKTAISLHDENEWKVLWMGNLFW